MDIILKMQEKTIQFERLTQADAEQNEVIAKANTAKEQIKEEMIRLQGEYRLLVEMGQEDGLLDETGQPVQEVEAEIVKIEE